MSKNTKPSIVFAHGLWADGSCFSKVIPALLAEGYEVMSTPSFNGSSRSAWAPPPTRSTAATSPCSRTLNS